jgi:LPXTG-site transpeptidase (sortase) family protein
MPGIHSNDEKSPERGYPRETLTLESDAKGVFIKERETMQHCSNRSICRFIGGPERSLARTLFALVALLNSAVALAETTEPTPPPETPSPEYSTMWLQNPWTGDTRLVRVPEPDTALWNATRIEDYAVATEQAGAPPLGVLTISRLGLQAPIYNGTDEFNLDRGLGRIKGMARLDEPGHLGISGHRDGFFRILKDLEVGDRIMVRGTDAVNVFEVQSFSIVDKHDASILKEQDDWKLTLVTCYPFYFVGNAPKRYIVHATPVTLSP